MKRSPNPAAANGSSAAAAGATPSAPPLPTTADDQNVATAAPNSAAPTSTAGALEPRFYMECSVCMERNVSLIFCPEFCILFLLVNLLLITVQYYTRTCLMLYSATRCLCLAVTCVAARAARRVCRAVHSVAPPSRNACVLPSLQNESHITANKFYLKVLYTIFEIQG